MQIIILLWPPETCLLIFCKTIYIFIHKYHFSAQSLQSCLTLCDPIGCSLPGSSVHGILQARMLEWIAMLTSSGSSGHRDRTCISSNYFGVIQLRIKRAIFFHNSGGWKFKIQVLAKLISGMTSLLGLQTLFTVLAHGLFSSISSYPV